VEAIPGPVWSAGGLDRTDVPRLGPSSVVPVVNAEEEAVVDASTPTGQRGSPMDVPRGTNSPADIGGRSYVGHVSVEEYLEALIERGKFPE
jgi:hypothetical protein